MKRSTRSKDLSRRRLRRQAGFSLLEMIVGVIIFGIVTGAVYLLLRVGTSSRFTALQEVEAVQNVRVGMNLFARECLNAGVDYFPTGAQIPDNGLALLGFANDAGTVADRLMPIMPGDGVVTNSLSGASTDRVTFIYGDDTFVYDGNGADGTAGTADDVHAPINIKSLTSNKIATVSTYYSNAPFNVGELYLITTSGTAPQSAIGVCTAKTGTDKVEFDTDALGINQPGTSAGVIKTFAASITAAQPARVSRITMVTYGVDAGGTLSRTLWGVYGANTDVTGSGSGGAAPGTQNFVEPLAFNVEDLQIKYLLKDGTITDSPAPTSCNNIRQIQVSITVRSPEVDPKTKKPARTTLTNTFNTRNLAYTSR